MTILDRYMLRQFVQIFVICFLSLAGLYVVIDAFQHLDNFTAYADEHGSLVGVMAEYYAYQSFELFDRTSGMIAMIAAMFTVTWLQRHQEMTAMMAAGISKLRIVKPIIFAVVLLSVFAAANREFVIPQVRSELTRDTKDLAAASLAISKLATMVRPTSSSAARKQSLPSVAFCSHVRAAQYSFQIRQTIGRRERVLSRCDCRSSLRLLAERRLGTVEHQQTEIAPARRSSHRCDQKGSPVAQLG